MRSIELPSESISTSSRGCKSHVCKLNPKTPLKNQISLNATLNLSLSESPALSQIRASMAFESDGFNTPSTRCYKAFESRSEPGTLRHPKSAFSSTTCSPFGSSLFSPADSTTSSRSSKAYTEEGPLCELLRILGPGVLDSCFSHLISPASTSRRREAVHSNTSSTNSLSVQSLTSRSMSPTSTTSPIVLETPAFRSPAVWKKSTKLDDIPRDTSNHFFLFDGTLQLEYFKVALCRIESVTHDRKTCAFYHSLRDHRRVPVNYRAEQCPDHFDSDTELEPHCPRKNRCDKCHNRHELLYHPEIYKQRFCSSYNELEDIPHCHRGQFCAFAHTRSEIRSPLFAQEDEARLGSIFFMLRFKTLWCPYGVQHDWHGCLYAHTYQDCRRSPHVGYGSEPCPYWQKDLHSADYKRRCPYGPCCPYSHGSKEQLYHPAYYKSMPCADHKSKGRCPRMQLCAFYHDPSERRHVNLTKMPALSNLTEEDCLRPRATDYSKPISREHLSLLQPSFMNPPLFNLDDFEAFGHTVRPSSDRSNRGRQLMTTILREGRTRVVGQSRVINSCCWNSQPVPDQRPPPNRYIRGGSCGGGGGGSGRGSALRRKDQQQRPQNNNYVFENRESRSRWNQKGTSNYNTTL